MRRTSTWTVYLARKNFFRALATPDVACTLTHRAGAGLARAQTDRYIRSKRPRLPSRATAAAPTLAAAPVQTMRTTEDERGDHGKARDVVRAMLLHAVAEGRAHGTNKQWLK